MELKFKFQPPAPKSRSFWFRIQNDLVHGTLKTTELFVPLTDPSNYFGETGTQNSSSGYTIQKIFGPSSSHPKFLGFRLHTPVFFPHPCFFSHPCFFPSASGFVPAIFLRKHPGILGNAEAQFCAISKAVRAFVFVQVRVS